ncbi:MAG: hypothetical protein GX055_07325 [Desulfovibrionales bacterium]|nr:hypothetical protein [Desulfovibrionales bacterium]
MTESACIFSLARRVGRGTEPVTMWADLFWQADRVLSEGLLQAVPWALQSLSIKSAYGYSDALL